MLTLHNVYPSIDDVDSNNTNNGFLRPLTNTTVLKTSISLCRHEIYIYIFFFFSENQVKFTVG